MKMINIEWGWIALIPNIFLYYYFYKGQTRSNLIVNQLFQELYEILAEEIF